MNDQINQIAREIYALEPMRVYDPEIKDFREQTFDELEEGFIELFNKVARYVIADRRRVVEPLLKMEENISKIDRNQSEVQFTVTMCKFCNDYIRASRETLKRAGITEEHKQ